MPCALSPGAVCTACGQAHSGAESGVACRGGLSRAASAPRWLVCPTWVPCRGSGYGAHVGYGHMHSYRSRQGRPCWRRTRRSREATCWCRAGSPPSSASLPIHSVKLLRVASLRTPQSLRARPGPCPGALSRCASGTRTPGRSRVVSQEGIWSEPLAPTVSGTVSPIHPLESWRLIRS